MSPLKFDFINTTSPDIPTTTTTRTSVVTGVTNTVQTNLDMVFDIFFLVVLTIKFSFSIGAFNVFIFKLILY